MRRQVSIEDKPSTSCNSWNKQAGDRQKRSGLYDSIEDRRNYASSTYSRTSNWLLAPSLLMPPRLKWANVSLSHLALPNEPLPQYQRKASVFAISGSCSFAWYLKRLLTIQLFFYWRFQFVLFRKLYMSHIPLPGTCRKSLTNVKGVQLVNHGGPKQTAA